MTPADHGLRDGLPIRDWYASEDRPKPIRDRYAKLEALRDLGVEPYGYSYEPTHDMATAPGVYVEDAEEQASVRVAGRILSFRDMGKSVFAHLGDHTGRLQVYCKRERLRELDADVLGLLDLGDWVGVEGPLFRTRTGEVTVQVERLVLLCKTLRPLPLGKTEVLEDGTEVVHSEFADVEMRYRQRYADLATNAGVRDVFAARAHIVRALRKVLDQDGYLEVETPILQPIYGVAFARPFTTHHNTLDRTLYLRIADELYLKRLIVGNLDRVYEIGKVFRNEGLDRTHNPEFTMLELYRAYADYEDMMTMSERLVGAAADAVLDGPVVE
ncbi:MAG: lysine--tRNA ligase, partial [Gemmatimonadales bacterium]